VSIEKRGGTYRVPVRINDTITLPFLLDTGASDLVIPTDVVLTLIRADALTSSDFVGKSHYRLADGSEAVSDVVVLREVQVGEHVVRNVMAIISPAQGEPLLGQSFLSKFGAVTLDCDRRVLVLSR
jgi:clan AA aspartic protease (TIGR02281 family)